MVFLLFILITAAQSLVYRALEEGVQIKEGDEIISTLGLYKITFISNDCSFNFYKFNQASLQYLPLANKFQGDYQGKCLWLQGRKDSIVTDTGQIFLQFSVNTTSRSYLIVDDLGNLRFVGLEGRQGDNLPVTGFQQITFSNNSQPSSYVFMLDAFQSVRQQFANPITNSNNWIFFFTSQLVISKATVFRNFILPNAFFSQSGIFDIQNETFPYAAFDGIKYDTICGDRNQIRGPFVIEIGQYWPVVTIYDQGGYKLFEYSVEDTNGYNPCPEEMFLFQNKCLNACPTQYYHLVEQQKGRCVLNCPSGSIIDNVTKICSCKNQFPLPSKPKFSCVNTTASLFGCSCSSGFMDKPTQRCVSNCSNGSVGYEGVCLDCGVGCVSCEVGQNGSRLIVCVSCSTGFTLNNGQCVESCTGNCQRCSGSICIACRPFFALLNNFCIPNCATGTTIKMLPNLTTSCVPTSTPVSSPCPIQCLQCSNSSLCIVCKPGYILVVTPPRTSCTRKTILFSCSSPLYATHGNICYNNQSSGIATLLKCRSTIAKCFLCLYQSPSTCISCQTNFYLEQNRCVSQCSKGYYLVNDVCLVGIGNCSRHGFREGFLNSSFNVNTPLTNQIYLSYINQKERLNEPYGYGLWAMKQYAFSNSVANVIAEIFFSEEICQQCSLGFGLSPDYKSCQPCPSGCLLCLYSFDNSCIASNQQELSLYSYSQGLTSCHGFVSQNDTCIDSCPTNTIPVFNSTYNKLQCAAISSVVSAEPNYVKVDGCTFQMDNQKYIHKFIFSQPLKYRNLTTARLLQGTPVSVSADGSSVSIQSSQPSAVLNLSGVVQNYQSVNNNYPASTVYGVSAETSFRSYLSQDYAWIGYIFSIAILLTHFIFIGNNYMYKMDNLIIFCQAIFYFLFIRLLSSKPVAQYYYGWGWLHLSFYPNYFISSLDSAASSAAPYALFNLDANFIRNAGSSISLFLAFLPIWLLASILCYVIDMKFKRAQIWYYQICRNSFCATFELLSFNVFYWAVAYSHYDQDGNSTDTFAGMTAFCIIAILGYTLIRLYFEGIACAYMIKRIVYASVLASSYQNVGYVAILVSFQIIFTLFRFIWQKPKERHHKIYLIVEELATIFGLLILYLVTQVIAVAFLVSLTLYLWYISLTVDLVDVFLMTKNMVRSGSWFPCLSEDTAGEEQGSSKEDIQDGVNTNRPFNSNVDK